MFDSPYQFFVGIDLGSKTHRVRIVDHTGAAMADRSIDHDGAGIRQFLEWLGKSAAGASPSQVAIGLEAPRGAIIDALLEQGYALFSINPKQLDRFRDRFSLAGAKDDDRDALVLASSLRTDLWAFRRLDPDDSRIVRLRELSRGEDLLREQFRGAANQLWSLLQRYFPALLALSSAADDPWIWNLLERCRALPSRAARMRTATIQTLLRHYHIRRLSAEQVREQLAQPLPLRAGVENALAEQVLLLIPRLQLLHRQRLDTAARIEQLLEELSQDENFTEHRSLAILRSVPGVGRVCAATVLAEAFTPLIEMNYRALRALAGVAPITQQSGKSCVVSMRRACHRRIRHAITYAADIHRQNDPRAAQLYARLRQRGHTHFRALRGVADRLLHLICVLIHQGTEYDPARRTVRPGLAAASQ